MSKNIQKEWLSRAQNLSGDFPDRVVSLVDSIARHVDQLHILPANYLKLLQLKQKAFTKLKLTDSACITGERIREVAAQIPDSLAMAETLIALYTPVDYNHIRKAEPYMPGAIYTLTHEGKLYEAALVTALNGTVLTNAGNYVKAQQYLLKAYKVFDDLDSLRDLAKVCTSIGHNYAGIGSLDESTLYYSKSLKISEIINDTVNQVSAFSNMGINYRFKSPDTAMLMYQKALQLLPAGNAKLGMKIKFNMANLYLDKKDFKQGAAIMKEVEQNCAQTKYMEGVAIANNGLAGVYFLAKQYPEALERYKKAIEAFRAIGLYQYALMSQAEQIDCYREMGDYKNAFSSSEALQKIKDSVFAKEKLVAVHELEKKYQTEKKELENAYLKKNATNRNIALIILIAAVIALAYLLKKTNWLYKQRGLAYSVLMERYKAERQLHLREKVKNDSTAVAFVPILPGDADANNLLIKKLEQYYHAQKPYLNPKLKVEDVALSLDIPQREITQAFKSQDNLNFNVFSNRFRVEEVRRLFDEPSNVNLKLETIAAQAGFGNRQSFYDAFEQVTGVKPGYYRKNILQQSRVA